MVQTPTRRAFMAGGMTTVGTTLCAPTILSAQVLSHNDIWTKQPNAETLRSSVTIGFDDSSSMKGDEPLIQREGTAQAIEHPNLRYVVNNRTAEGHGGVAVCCVKFNSFAKVISPSGIGHNRDYFDPVITEGGWAILENDADVDQLAAFIRSEIRPQRAGETNIVDALHVGQMMHRLSPYATAKRVVDISCDGWHNVYASVSGLQTSEKDEACKDLLVSKVEELANQDDIVVNAFVMIGENDTPPILEIDGERRYVGLHEYSERFLQTQPSAERLIGSGFTIPILKDDGMRTAYPIGMTRKLLREFF